MKRITKILTLLLVVSISVPQLSAQTRASIQSGSSKAHEEQGKTLSVRAQNMFEDPSAASSYSPWTRVIYRELDLRDECNLPIYFPEDYIEGEENMFRIVMRLLTENKITAYEYLDGRELFTSEYEVDVKETLERFRIIYEEKGTGKAQKVVIDPSDVPTNEVLSLYMRQKWVFDSSSSQLKCEIEAICPILHRQDEFGGEPIKYPMFWVKYSDLRPYLAQQYIVTSNTNNVKSNSIDDFFKKEMYRGEIYKTMNMRNMSIMQLYPEPAAQDSARAAIEAELKGFKKGLWVSEAPTPTVQQPQLVVLKEGTQPVEGTIEPAPAEEVEEKKSSSRSSRGESSSSSSSTKSEKVKKQKSTSSAPVRSVRSTK